MAGLGSVSGSILPVGTGSAVGFEAVAGGADGTVCARAYAMVRDAVGEFVGDIGHGDGTAGEGMSAVCQVLDLAITNK